MKLSSSSFFEQHSLYGGFKRTHYFFQVCNHRNFNRELFDLKLVPTNNIEFFNLLQCFSEKVGFYGYKYYFCAFFYAQIVYKYYFHPKPPLTLNTGKENVIFFMIFLIDFAALFFFFASINKCQIRGV